MLVGLAASDAAMTPTPDSATFNEGLEDVLVIAIFPFAVPAEEGANVALKVVL